MLCVEVVSVVMVPFHNNVSKQLEDKRIVESFALKYYGNMVDHTKLQFDKHSVLKADFHSPVSGARDFFRLILALGMRTYNKKHVNMIARSPEKVKFVQLF